MKRIPITPTIPQHQVDFLNSVDSNTSQALSKVIDHYMILIGNKEAIESRLREIKDARESLDDEEERLSATLAAVSVDTKKLEDPEVQRAIAKIGDSAVNSYNFDKTHVTNLGIKNMAEKQLKGPMPNGFINKVREYVDSRIKT